MPTRRVIIGFVLAVAMGAGPGVAADTSAKDFVTKIYAAYKGKDAPGALGTADEDLVAIFEP